MKAGVVAERTETVHHVAVAVDQLVATRRVDDHVTSGHAHSAILAVTCTVLLYQAGNVLQQEPVVQLV